MNDQGGPSSEAKLHAMDYWQVLRNRYGVILLAFFLVFMTAAVITYILPKEYLGKVTLQINRELHDMKIFHGQSQPGRGMYIPPTFIETEFKVITSKNTLYQVIDSLKLDERWAITRPQAFSKLYANVDTKEERGTDLITIEYFDTEAQVSANIANAVAAAYQNRRMSLERERSNNALDTLQKQLSDQSDKVEEARLRMLDLAERYRIIDLAAMQNRASQTGDPVTGTGTILMSSMQDTYTAESNIAQIKMQIEKLSGLDGEQLIQSAAMLDINDASLQTLLPSYQRSLLEKRALLDSGLGPRHPKVRAAEGQLSQTKEMLEKAVVGVRTTLKTKLDMAERALALARDIEEGKKDTSMDERRKYAEYSEASKEYELQKSMLANMQAKYATEQVDLTMPKVPITIHEEAEVASRPAKPNVPLNLILGAIVGLAFGIGLAFFLEYLDTSVKTLEDVERYLQVPVLAVIPKDVGVLHKQSGLTPDAEAYRILRTNIEFNRKSADANAITVVSGGAGEGKSTTLVKLAYICAQGGYNTLMIDGDLRRPKLHTFFDINNSVGLTNYLTTELMLEDVILQTPVDNLYFMPSGILPADAAGILNSRRMSELIADVKNRFDLVLIDSPPILGVSDAAVLASEVDLTMVVIQHRKLPRSMLLRVKQCVENVGGNLLGVVLNNVDVRSDSQYQYYTSYYTYYSPTNTQTRSTRRKERSEIETAPAETPASTPASGDDEY